MEKWKRSDFLQELETRIWESCGTVYKLGGIAPAKTIYFSASYAKKKERAKET